MTTQSQMKEPAYFRTVGGQSCPLCNAALLRTARRPIDRFLSRFVAVQRYRCVSFTCQWEGNFRTSSLVRGGNGTVTGALDSTSLSPLDDTPAPPLPKSFVVHMALVVVGLLFVVMFTMTDWLPGSPLAGIVG